METIIIVSNLIGTIALLFWVYSIQKNDKKQILKLQLLANVFYAIQYIIIGAITAGMMNIISVIRYSVFYKMEDQEKEKLPFWVLAIFVISIILVGIFTYKSPLDVIPIGISLLYTYVIWQKNNKIIRYGVTVAAIIWIYYNVSVQAYISVIGNLFEMLSGMIAIYRFDLKRVRKSLNKNEIKK